jgi:hypothetical protein
MMRQEDLPKFAELEGTDIEQFMNPRDAARSILSGTDTSKRRPEETSRWFADTAEEVLKHAQAAEAAGAAGKEAISTIADLKILAWLARYYAARLPAAVSYNVFRETGDLNAFDAAIGQERRAVSAWAEIVKAAGDVYADDLPLGVHRVGFPRHWKEELAKLEQGLNQLIADRAQARAVPTAPQTKPRVPEADNEPPRVKLEQPPMARPGQDVRIGARAEDASGVKSMRLRYRHLTQIEDYQTADMSLDARTGLFVGRIPGDFVVPRWNLVYFVEAIDNRGNGRNYPDLDVEAPYVIVPVQRQGRF